MRRINQILKAKVSNQEKIDKLLQYDCEIRTELGQESTESERKEVSILSDKIIDEIVKLDPNEKYLQTTRDN